ncbi:MAG: methylmalonyl-CoA mutase family protein [Candidatus Omnitrophota bacterium]
MSNEIKLDNELNLDCDFPPSTFEEWKSTAVESLKGAPFEKKLVTPTYEEIDLQPIYTARDLENLSHLDQDPGLSDYSRGATAGGYLGHPWEVCREIPSISAAHFNDALKYDLKRGQTAVNLIPDKASVMGLDSDMAPAGDVGNSGPSLSTLEDLETALADIDTDQYPIHIHAGYSALPIISLFNAFLEKQNKKINTINGSIDADPLGSLVTHGNLPVSIETAFDHMAHTASWAQTHAPGLKTIGVSGLPYHNAGADAIRELAYTLATAVEYIDRMSEHGVSIDTAAQQIRFTFGVGPFYFMEIAKIRAARILWSKIVDAYGGNPSSRHMTIHARTSFYNQTAYDPYVNMLRTTTEAFSAMVAGVDSLHTNAFNEVYGMGDEFSRRTARNIQIILGEESRLNQLIDPAGGSYFVETLTSQVAEKAWTIFQDIQSKGGMLQALKQGFPQSEVVAVDKKRKMDIAKRKLNIVGTNFSANVKEKKLEPSFPDIETVHKDRTAVVNAYKTKRDSKQKSILEDKRLQLKHALDSGAGDLVSAGTQAVLCGATLGEIAAAATRAGEPMTLTPLLPCRASDMFEALRDAVESYKVKTGAAPKLFLANMGPLAQYKARADFSQSFFEIGGFDVIYPQGFDTPIAAANAALESKAPVVVICSTDDTYPQLVPGIVSALKEKQPGITVVLAGYPKDQVDMHKQSGVDEFIFLGVDAYQVLSGILKKIGVLS